MPGGSIKYVHVVAHAVSDELAKIEFIGAVLDVTERKQAEETLRRSQAELARVTWVMTMGELTASIADEINQPLAAVVTNANACLRWLAAPIPNLDEAREAVARIARDGKRASDVIDGFALWSRRVSPSGRIWTLTRSFKRSLVGYKGNYKKMVWCCGWNWPVTYRRFWAIGCSYNKSL